MNYRGIGQIAPSCDQTHFVDTAYRVRLIILDLYKRGYFGLSDIQHYRIYPLAANNQFFQIQLHQMLKISVELFLGKIGEKFRLGTSVDFTNVVYQLPFTHKHSSFKSSKKNINLRNIDREHNFSLAYHTRA